MRTVLLLFLIVSFIACSQNSNKNQDRKQELSTKIEAYKDSLYNQNDFAYLNDALVERAIKTYMDYAQSFPDDELSPDYMFDAANLYRYKRKFFEALNVYENIQKQYPDYEKTPQCLFLQAFIYENELGDLDQAKAMYEDFLIKYPNDAFAKDAKHCLDNLGKPLEEIIKEFEEASDEAAKEAI